MWVSYPGTAHSGVFTSAGVAGWDWKAAVNLTSETLQTAEVGETPFL